VTTTAACRQRTLLLSLLTLLTLVGAIGLGPTIDASASTHPAAQTRVRAIDHPTTAVVGAEQPGSSTTVGVSGLHLRQLVSATGVATEAGGAEAGLPSASQLADDVASATGGTIKELPSGYSVAVPNGGRGIVVRVMESGGGRTNYYRVSIPGKEAFTVEGAASVDRALTHIDISANSLEEILQIIKGAGG